MKTIFWTLVLALGWTLAGLAEPTGSNGIWIDPPGWIGQCFVCPDGETSDCMIAEPIFIRLERGKQNRTCHITQLYPAAWSEQTGLQYNGILSLTVQYGKRDTAMLTATVHWQREDGLGVLIRQQIHLRYMNAEGWQPVEVLQARDSFTCH